jgi:thymidine kinase
MGSAKSLRLLTTAYNFEENGIPFMVLKPSIDTRDGEGVIKSRVGIERECIVIDTNDNIYDAVEKYNNILISTFSKLEWILIDECQFLSEEQVDQLANIVDKLGINVMCFGLRTDFTSHCFPASR